MYKATRAEKLEIIWYHYKFLIIIVAFILIVSIYSFATRTPEKNSALSVVLLGEYINSDNLIAMQNTATSDLIQNHKSNTIIKVDFYPNTDNDLNNSANSAIVQKFTVMVATNEIDVIVMDKTDFISNVAQGMSYPLDKLPGLSDLLNSKNSLIKAKGAGNSGTHIYGIELSNNPLLKKTGFDMQDKVIGIVSNSKHIPTAIKFIKLLFANTPTK